MEMDYNKTFIKNEFKTILGKNWGNYWILLSVFLLTIGSLSFSRAGLEFIKQKMEDPFINWVNVKDEPNLKNLYESLESNQDSLKKYFHIKSLEKNNFLVEFVKGEKRIIGRTLKPNSDLWSKILNESNIRYNIKRNSSIAINDFGWVITADFIISYLGYNKNALPKDFSRLIPLFIDMEYKTTKFSEYVPIPIIAIVDRLPDDIDFVAPTYFYEQYKDVNHPFDVSDSLKYFANIKFIVDDENLQDQIGSAFGNIDIEWENSEEYDLAYKDAILLSAILNDTTVSKSKLDSICSSIVKQIQESNHKIYRYYDYKFDDGYKELNPDYVSVMFSDLSKVKEFQTWAKDNYDIRIDMAQIEAKENFNLFNNLANFLCMAIIVISTMFVVIFLYFLINAHFQKISKNLGTIMAFGLDNSSIVRIYLTVFMGLIIAGLTTATAILWIIQYILNLSMFGWGIINGKNLQYLSMQDVIVIIFLCGILSLSSIVTYFIMSKKLKSTPGDLIYERNV